MNAEGPSRRSYDHRLRAIVNEGRDPSLLADLEIPRSTVSSWMARGPVEVVTLDRLDKIDLQVEVLKLRRRVRVLATVVGLLKAVIRASGFEMAGQRLPTHGQKSGLLATIDRAITRLPLVSVLRVIGLSASRYHSWKRSEKVCELDDRGSCPQTFPGQLTPTEVMAMKSMVVGEEYRHVPMRGLALLAQRAGSVFASVSTWAKQVRARGWRRPRLRLYPAKPKVGVRASKPNEIWHIDLTVLRLLDGTRAYVHAIIDNFSRRILAWTMDIKVDPTSTCKILHEAGEKLLGMTPTVYADSGVENVNGLVDELHNRGVIQRVLAQVEVAYSNSMIEAFWRSMKHQWLYLNQLDGFEKVRGLVAFYVGQHNTVIPHAAFDGQTPDEIYFGTGAAIPDELAERRKRARKERLAFNRGSRCGQCPVSDSNHSELVAIANA
jgi:putative transposase